MEVKTDVCCKLLALANIVRDQHKLVTVYPDRFRVHDRSNLINATGDARIHSFKLGPFVYLRLQ